jgi:hypothetical protein
VSDVRQALQAEAGEAHLDGSETAHLLRMGDGETEDGRSADVLPSQVNRSDVELVDEKVQVFGRHLAVVRTRFVRRVAEAAQIDGEDAVSRREQRDELSKGPPGLGKAVDQKDRRAALPGSYVVKVGAVNFRVVVGDACDGGGGGLDALEQRTDSELEGAVPGKAVEPAATEARFP